MAQLVDLQLNISAAARAVLHRLSERDAPSSAFWRITTWAWYNCRERGVALTVERYRVSRLVIVFGECRNSDEIFVDSWEGLPGDYSNGPKVEHLTDEAYESRRMFPSVDKAAECVRKLIEKRVGQKL